MVRNIGQTFNIAKIRITREEPLQAYTIRREDQRIAHTKSKTKTAGKNREEK